MLLTCHGYGHVCYFTSLKYLFLGKAGLPMCVVPLEVLLHLHLVAKTPCVRLQDKDACLPATPQGRSKARSRPTPPAGRMSVTPSVGRLSHEGRDIEQWQLSAALAGKQGDFQCWSWHGLKLSEAFWGWFICLSNGNKLPQPQYSQANKRQPKKHS